jgi:hypothetical protein
MKQYLFLVLLLTIIIVSSCRTKKITTDYYKKTDSIVSLNIQTEKFADYKNKSFHDEVKKTISTDNTIENIIIREYSEPDSAGTQSIIKETIINRDLNKKEQTFLESSKHDSINVKSIDRTKDKSIINVIMEENQSTKETVKNYTFFKALFWLIIIASVILILRFMIIDLIP